MKNPKKRNYAVRDIRGKVFQHSRKEYLVWLENAYSSAFYAGYRKGYKDAENKQQEIIKEHHTYPPKKVSNG